MSAPKNKVIAKYFFFLYNEVNLFERINMDYLQRGIIYERKSSCLFPKSRSTPYRQHDEGYLLLIRSRWQL